MFQNLCVNLNVFFNELEKGKLAKQFIDKGELVPDDLVGEIIVSELEKHKETANLLLDGKQIKIEDKEKIIGLDF